MPRKVCLTELHCPDQCDEMQPSLEGSDSHIRLCHHQIDKQGRGIRL